MNQEEKIKELQETITCLRETILNLHCKNNVLKDNNNILKKELKTTKLMLASANSQIKVLLNNKDV